MRITLNAPQCPIRVCAFFAALLLTACAPYNPYLPNDAARAKTPQHARFNSTSLAEAATKRCGIIVSGMRVEPIHDDEIDATSIALTPEGGSNSVIVIGLAAAIDQRGYFVTAAHTTANPPLNLVFYDGERIRVAPARVVAKIEKQSGSKLDVAIVCVDANLRDVFQWADTTQLRDGETLFEVGSKTTLQSATNLVVDRAYFAGSFRDVYKRSPGGLVFKSNLPTRGSDSGGPIVTTDGKLLAVLSGSKDHFLRQNDSFAVRPDIDWVAASIAADLQAIHENSTEPITDKVESTDPVRLTIRLTSSPWTTSHRE